MSRTRSSSSRIIWLLALVALFAFRLAFGLSKELFTDDETQIYLLGLRFHATQHWPFFGPDVVWTQSQIPGALQALLVGLPFDAAPIPEAPYVWLNLLSMGALCLFAAYLSARLRSVPRWLIWGWLLTIPWTLEFSTHILNTSYVLPASLVFFIAFFEAWPPLTTRRVPAPVAHLVMGAGLGWLFQVHMSWPLLLPFIAVAFLARGREGPRALAVAGGAFTIGLLATFSLVLPTVVSFGLFGGGGGTEQNLHLHWRSPVTTFGTTVGRLLSFASFEVGRFITSPGGGSPIVFLTERWWLAPVAAFVWLVGIIHPIWMATTAFRRSPVLTDWPAVRWTTVATAVLVTASFFFVMEPAQARSFYIVAPVALLFGAYCWTFIDSPRWRKVAAIVLSANLVFQGALAITRFSGPSLYMNRPVVAAAIRLGRPGLFGYRRAFARDVPANERSSGASAPAVADLEIVDAKPRLVRSLTAWSVVVHNTSLTTGYRSLVCQTRYYDAAGSLVDQRVTEVSTLVEPGASVPARVVDSVRWGQTFARGEVAILSADMIDPFPPIPPASHPPRATR